MNSSRWALVALLLIALNLRPAIAAVGPVLELIRADLKLSHGAAGLLTLLPVLCMGAFAPAAGWLHKRLGLHRAIMCSTLLLACANLARALSGAWPLWSSTLLAGAAIAVLGPLLAAFIKGRFARHGFGVTTLLSAGICLGASLAAGFTAPLNSWLPWNWALAGWALPAFIAAAAWLGVAADEDQRIRTAADARSLWKEPLGYLLALVFGLQSAVFYALLAWLAPAYGELGLSATAAGGLLGVMTLMQIGGTLIAGAVGRVRDDRRAGLLVFALASMAGLIGLAAAPLWAPWLWMTWLGIGTGGLFATTMMLPLDFGATPASTGAWTSAMLSGGYLIAAAGPWLAGLMRDVAGHYPPVFLALASANGVLCFLCLALKPAKRAGLPVHR